MGVPKPLLVATGGIVGAGTRWLAFEAIDRAVVALAVVNTIGCLVLGIVAFSRWQDRDGTTLWAGVGFCGAFTTFSTFAVEVAVRLDNSRWADAVGVAVGGLALGIVGVIIGRSVGRSLLGEPTR